VPVPAEEEAVAVSSDEALVLEFDDTLVLYRSNAVEAARVLAAVWSVPRSLEIVPQAEIWLLYALISLL
jgi:hypothetical protein